MRKLFTETNKYKILSLVRYLGDGLFYPFFALYLKSRNLTESNIGFILSIAPLLAIIMNPIYSKVCKSPRITKNVLTIITVIEGVCIGLIAFFKDFYVISAITLLIAIFGSCHYGLMDALAALYCNHAEINYSSIRMFGSAAYIIATAIGGVLCSFSFSISFIACGVLFILSGLIYHLLLPLIPKDETKDNEKIKVREVISNKSFIFFGIIYMLLLGTTKITDNFFSVYLETRGVGSKEFGLIYSYFVFFEVVSLIVFDKLLKRSANAYVWFFISCICLILRTLCCYLYLPVIVVVLATVLRGFGYAIILHITYTYVISIVGEKKGTLGIMIITLLYSIFVFAFNNIGGVVIENYSYQVFYLMSMIIVAFTMFLIIIKLIIERKLAKA